MASPIPGGTVLATYSASPDYRQQKALGLAQALQGAMGSYRARREQEEARDLDEIQRFYQLALQDSELAAAQGDWFVKKYGSKYPQLAPMIDVLKNRGAEAGRIRGAGSKLMTTQAAIEEKYRRDQEAVAAMPDEVPVEVPIPSLGVFGSGAPAGSITLPIPNAEKAVRGAQLERVQPWAFQNLALMALSPQERAYARANKGLVTVDEFNPFGDDVPIEQRALYADQLGWLGEDSQLAKAARVRNQLEASPADLQGQGYETSERKAKHQETLEEARERARLTAANQLASDTRAMARVKERQRDTGGGRGKAKGEPLWKAAVADSDKRLAEWQKGLTAALSGLPRTPKGQDTQANVSARLAKAKNEYLAANGPPVRLSLTNAERIQAKVRAMALAPEDEKLETAKMVEEFSRLMRVPRTTIDDAMKIVLNRESVTMPANIRKLVGTNEAAAAKAQELRESGKSWAEIERLIRQAGAVEQDEE